MVHMNAAVLTHQVAILKDQRRQLTMQKRALLAESVRKACDATDGVRDGLVSDPPRCAFDPSTLLCHDTDTESCLTQPQLDAVKQFYAGVKTTTGEAVYPGSSFGVESAIRTLGGGAPSDLQTNVFRYLAHQDPKWDVLSFDLDKDLSLGLQRAGVLEASDPNLARFKARGGKLILFHGWADPGPAPASTINYYARVGESMGAQGDWMRLFLVPGMDHCRGGPGPNEADFATALAQWRESGVAPDSIRVSHRTEERIDRTRLLCPYPQIARYKGAGSTDDAASFECVRP
jgi:feruloyl esterase